MRPTEPGVGCRRETDGQGQSVALTMTPLAGSEVVLLLMPRELLIHRALAAYDAVWTELKGVHARCTGAESIEFQCRVQVNYLRHACTPYQHRIDALEGRVDSRDRQFAERMAVLAGIALAYPELADECQRQVDRAKAKLARKQAEAAQ
jgi:hypothetical protein